MLTAGGLYSYAFSYAHRRHHRAMARNIISYSMVRFAPLFASSSIWVCEPAHVSLGSIAPSWTGTRPQRHAGDKSNRQQPAGHFCGPNALA
jgi:hypothetical protein